MPIFGVTLIFGIMINQLQTAVDLLEAVFVPLLLLELFVFRRARRLGWPRVKEMLANGGTFVLFVVAAAVGVVLWDPVFNGLESLVPWNIPTNWWTVPVAIVLADFIYYWEHRISHERRVLWDLAHSVHHSSPMYDQTTSIRLGAFDGLFALVFTVPMVLLGFSAELSLVSSAIVLAYQTWIHTEIIDRMPRWFEAVLNTPSHHRAHHGDSAPYLDVNYGGILIVWDKLFGTFQPEIERPSYGLTEQIDSANPFVIQLGQARGLVSTLRRDPDWRTRWRRLWSRPGWQPDQADVVGGAEAAGAPGEVRS